MEERGKKKFNPRTHAAIYGVALFYLGYLLVQAITDAVNGGAAAAPLVTGVTIAVLVVAFAVVAILTWRMFRMKVEEDPEEGEE